MRRPNSTRTTIHEARTAAEKMELIRLVEGSDLPVRRTLRELGVPRSTFYDWYQRYREHGRGGLEPRQPQIPGPVESDPAPGCGPRSSS